MLRSGGKDVEARAERVLEQVKQRDRATRHRIEKLPTGLVKAKITDLIAERKYENQRHPE